MGRVERVGERWGSAEYQEVVALGKGQLVLFNLRGAMHSRRSYVEMHWVGDGRQILDEPVAPLDQARRSVLGGMGSPWSKWPLLTSFDFERSITF